VPSPSKIVPKFSNLAEFGTDPNPNLGLSNAALSADSEYDQKVFYVNFGHFKSS